MHFTNAPPWALSVTEADPDRGGGFAKCAGASVESGTLRGHRG